jgi:dimethylhistidine N-methyltransferase
MNGASAQPVPAISSRAQVVRLRLAVDDFAADVRRGLTSHPKTLDPKYFYDDLGSILFEAICKLPEYYVGRAEEEILASRSDEIVKALGQPVRLVELGSGSARKTRTLIRCILSGQPHLEYIPVDIDASLLSATAEALVTEFATLSVIALAGTFDSAIEHLGKSSSATIERTLVLFLGSTIGNLEPAARRDLLRSLRRLLRPGDAVLLGADAVKSEAVLVPAYDDALGVTAAFNRNLLVRINRELDGAFDLSTFRHAARYDADLQRIEMHLVSVVQQSVRVDGIDIDFAEGETIHSENSYKFTSRTIEALASETSFEVTREWSDAQGFFKTFLLKAF